MINPSASRVLVAEQAESLKPALPFPITGEPIPRPVDKAQAAEYFRAARKALGLTVARLAALLRANPRTLNGWEGGKSPVDPSAWLLVQILLRYPNVRRWLEPKT